MGWLGLQGLREVNRETRASGLLPRVCLFQGLEEEGKGVSSDSSLNHRGK